MLEAQRMPFFVNSHAEVKQYSADHFSEADRVIFDALVKNVERIVDASMALKSASQQVRALAGRNAIVDCRNVIAQHYASGENSRRDFEMLEDFFDLVADQWSDSVQKKFSTQVSVRDAAGAVQAVTALESLLQNSMQRIRASNSRIDVCLQLFMVIIDFHSATRDIAI